MKKHTKQNLTHKSICLMRRQETEKHPLVKGAAQSRILFWGNSISEEIRSQEASNATKKMRSIQAERERRGSVTLQYALSLILLSTMDFPPSRYFIFNCRSTKEKKTLIFLRRCSHIKCALLSANIAAERYRLLF